MASAVVVRRYEDAISQEQPLLMMSWLLAVALQCAAVRTWPWPTLHPPPSTMIAALISGDDLPN